MLLMLIQLEKVLKVQTSSASLLLLVNRTPDGMPLREASFKEA